MVLGWVCKFVVGDEGILLRGVVRWVDEVGEKRVVLRLCNGGIVGRRGIIGFIDVLLLFVFLLGWMFCIYDGRWREVSFVDNVRVKRDWEGCVYKLRNVFWNWFCIVF